MSERESILIVDDQSENISIMIEALSGMYDLLAATDGVTALERANGDIRPDLVLLDVMMPEMDGHEVCRRLKDNPATRDIPVIFVTSLDNEDDEALGLGLGAVDYITKPISPPVVEARVRTHLQLIQAKRVLEHQNDILELRVQERTEDVVRAHRQRVEGLNHFANAVAHQIRNPVMAIGGMAGLLVKKTPENSPLADYAFAVRDNAVRLEHLVGVISQYTALNAGEIEPVPVGQILEEVLEHARTYAGEKGMELDVSPRINEGDITVDRQLVVQAMFEVLKNTVDFCENDRASISIEGGADICDEDLSASEQFYSTECRYGIRFVDDGPGVFAKDIPYLTDPFFTTKSLGVGLGLTKAKRIVCEELSGAMHIKSTHGSGLSVTMEFGLGG